MHAVLVSHVLEQPSLGPKVAAPTNLTGEAHSVRPDHVPQVRVEILEHLPAELTRVGLDVGVGVQVLLKLVADRETLSTNLADFVFGTVLVQAFI